MRRPVMAALATLAVASAVVGVSHGAAPSAQDRSRALASAAAVDRSDAKAIDGATARAQADRRLDAVPLPTGGNLNGVRWEELGSVVPAELEGLVEYNAVCQWLRARRDGRESDTAAGVLAYVAEWPALRDTESGKVVAGAVASGEDLAGVLADCDAAHEREVAYARSHGRPPSS